MAMNHQSKKKTDEDLIAEFLNKGGSITTGKTKPMASELGISNHTWNQKLTKAEKDWSGEVCFALLSVQHRPVGRVGRPHTTGIRVLLHIYRGVTEYTLCTRTQRSRDLHEHQGTLGKTACLFLSFCRSAHN